MTRAESAYLGRVARLGCVALPKKDGSADGRSLRKTGKSKACTVCGKEFWEYASRPRKVCSLQCRSDAVKAKRYNAEDDTYRCSKCREWKPRDQFVKGGKAGMPHSHCKPCNSEWFAERRGTSAERRKPYEPAYRLTDEQKKVNKREANRRQHIARRGAGQAPGRWDIGRMMCEQDARCAYCKQLLSGQYHIDHKTPVSRGGTNDLENLHLTCPRCNMIKGAMTHEEFLVSKKRRAVAW
jgi:5-methylcytosine-specific restriction endonuclease McrA